jgi:hypothetical protein
MPDAYLFRPSAAAPIMLSAADEQAYSFPMQLHRNLTIESNDGQIKGAETSAGCAWLLPGAEPAGRQAKHELKQA